MSWEMADCQRTILQEIAEPKCKRRDVAQSYWFALNSSERDTIDWSVVNKAIIGRWSFSALKWIKEQAWQGKCWKEAAALVEKRRVR